MSQVRISSVKWLDFINQYGGKIMNDYDVSKELCVKVHDELQQFATTIIKKNGIVVGKSASKYGDGFQFKIEAYSNDPITKQLATQLQDGIATYAEGVFAENGLELRSNRCKFGEGFQIIIKADKVVLGENGVNLSSEYAKNFRAYQFTHRLSPNALGLSAFINGKTVYLAGVDAKRNGDLQPVVLVDGKYRIFTNPEVLQKFWGKNLVEAK
jgi:hypothetical protein